MERLINWECIVNLKMRRKSPQKLEIQRKELHQGEKLKVKPQQVEAGLLEEIERR